MSTGMKIKNFDRAVYFRDHIQAIACEVYGEVIEVAAWNVGQRCAAHQPHGLVPGGVRRAQGQAES
jgi:hypothetical protein